jgi:F-type H+-transporting ATPase subunit delta
MAGENLQERRHIAEIYAKAFYELAVDQGAIESASEQMLLWQGLLSAQPELIRVFDSTLVLASDREAILDQLGDLLDPMVRSFFGVMNQRNRLGLIGVVVDAFIEEGNRRNDRVRVLLQTATEVDNATIEHIKSVLQKYLSKEPIVEHRVKPDLLGGFVAQAGDFLIDGSVKTKLVELQKRLLMRGEDEIQS